MAAWLNFCVIRCVIDVCSDSVLTLIFKSVDGCMAVMNNYVQLQTHVIVSFVSRFVS